MRELSILRRANCANEEQFWQRLMVRVEYLDLRSQRHSVDKDELILCELGVSANASTFEALLVAAWRTAPKWPSNLGVERDVRFKRIPADEARS